MALYRKFRREFNSFYEEMCKLYAKVKCEQRQDQLLSKKELKIQISSFNFKYHDRKYLVCSFYLSIDINCNHLQLTTYTDLSNTVTVVKYLVGH